jgi:hypothetical protein
MHCVAARHHLMPRIPDEAQARAVLCCRIISGRTMIDPLEPSPALTWYSPPSNQHSNLFRTLVNLSYILSSQTGKLWAADQLDAIARQYLPKSTRRIANTVRENLSLSGESVKTMGPVVTPLPAIFPPTSAIPDQSTIATQFIASSPAPISADAHLLYTGTSTHPMQSQSQDKLDEHDVYAHGPHSWSEM